MCLGMKDLLSFAVVKEKSVTSREFLAIETNQDIGMHALSLFKCAWMNVDTIFILCSTQPIFTRLEHHGTAVKGDISNIRSTRHSSGDFVAPKIR